MLVYAHKIVKGLLVNYRCPKYVQNTFDEKPVFCYEALTILLAKQ